MMAMALLRKTMALVVFLVMRFQMELTRRVDEVDQRVQKIRNLLIRKSAAG